MLNDLGFNITVKSMEYTEYKNALLQGNFDLYYGEVRLSPELRSSRRSSAPRARSTTAVSPTAR